MPSVEDLDDPAGYAAGAGAEGSTSWDMASLERDAPASGEAQGAGEQDSSASPDADPRAEPTDGDDRPTA
jgi:hypothetical protein